MTEQFDAVFSPFQLGKFTLKNRIVMAPLTRQSAEEDGTPTDEMAAYWARRARGGVSMIITEGTYENDELGCKAYLSQPGCANDKHVAGWKKTVDAVHALGVPIILQLMHGGRVTDPRCLFEGEQPVTASDSQSPGAVLYTDADDEKNDRGVTGDWPLVTFPPARAATEAEIERIAEGFAEGSLRGMEAGFDGVELHGANGYLYYQFIDTKQNKRTDQYGGSPENNVRAAKLACQKVRDAIGPDKIITLRLSQDGVDDFGGAWEGGVEYAKAIGEALADAPIDALHWASFDWTENKDPNADTPMPQVLKEASGLPMIVNGGISEGAHAEHAVTSGAADLCAVGRPMFAHPDWPHIIRSGEPYNWIEFDRKYVVKPSYDYSFGYPLDRLVPDWDPDFSKRRAK
ncbi:MAG: NADH:flavin oxidoreductase [Alphaproteobacteria bacterium]|nr:NADH:flavin oxidoreductase [Alphaproteobacteria bacterium]